MPSLFESSFETLPNRIKHQNPLGFVRSSMAAQSLSLLPISPSSSSSGYRVNPRYPTSDPSLNMNLLNHT
ncbi:hypothetical protein HanIR_Chr11g0530701 [Helianthus annuus]|nr:hypothetical protein HanIR_Chr11g0530701 [Helianthus annuus]